ncbi:MAG: TetR family transcriptional regulator [Betaproteobacteria bacterium HGW-Betaproteobacteria-20]|jgi:AcrR family transcriptional regulator|nr:MAG: TetR family transcriptional regulator [Betaproteobacteria bacterium HGW-Betaproteobacteria-20]
MPPKLKTEAERQQLRTLIIDAARELFVSKGVEAVTMREIARRIGYSATSIYLHFADKEAVLRAICETDFLALATSLKAILQIADPVARLLALGSGYAEFALSHPNHYRLMFMAQHAPRHPEDFSLEQNHPEQDAYFQLKIVVTDVFQAGRFKPELNDVDIIAQTVWAGMHGVCALEITMAQDTWVNWRDITARLQLMQSVLMSGLLK